MTKLDNRNTWPRRRALALSLGLLLGGALPTGAALAQAATHHFELAAQPLGTALNQLAEASGTQILVPPELVRGRSAPALRGDYSAEAALAQLLRGTGLTHKRTSSGVIAIVQQQPAAAPEKPRAAPPPKAEAATQAKPGTTEMEGMLVTGSRIRRTEIEGPSPVTRLTAQQIENEGYATVFEAMESLVMAGGEVETELSGGFSANASPINLRGLGPGRSLLLIDGRRAADYPFPYGGRSNFQNFGNIPSGAVQSIEVLAGGASAIYGADAVSGVVNVLLKRNYSGDEIKLRTGTSTMGGRDRVDLQWTGGKTGEDWSLTYAFQYYTQDLLYGFERDDWDLQRNPGANPLIGVQPDNGLRIRLGGTSSSRPLAAMPAGTCEKWGGEFVDADYRRVSGGKVVSSGKYCGTWNDAKYQHLSKGTRELAAYLFGNREINSNLRAWGSVQGWRSAAESLGGFESITGPHTDGEGRIKSFYDPQFKAEIAPERRLTPMELGGVKNMNQHYKERSLDLAAGLHGSLGGFDWDLTLSRADYYFERNRKRLIGNKVNDWFFGEQLGTRPNGLPIYQLNLDHWYNPLTPAEYGALSTTAHYEATSWVNTANFVVSGSLFELPAGPLGMAVVLEASRQGYKLESDPRVQPAVGELYNLTGTNGGGERDRYAAGVEFSLPLHDTLTASLAGRFDKYDDITKLNDARTWNAGLEWRPLHSLLLRANYATSFKAPDLHWVFSEGSGSYGQATDQLRCIANGAAPDCSGYSYSVYTVSSGDPNLTEETGKSWGAGLVWDIGRDFSANIDYWDIRLNGAIESVDAADVISAEAGCTTGKRLDGSAFGFSADSAYCKAILDMVTRVPEAGEQYGRISRILSGPINQSYMRVAGIDSGVQWRFDGGAAGRYVFRLDWSHTLRSELQVRAGDPVDRDWRDNPENLSFRSKSKASVNWRKGSWSANLSATRYGSLPKYDSTTGRTGIYQRWNANLGWQVNKQFGVKFYVNNLFNKLHPNDPSNTSFPYFYDAYSPVGREVALQLEYKLN